MSHPTLMDPCFPGGEMLARKSQLTSPKMVVSTKARVFMTPKFQASAGQYTLIPAFIHQSHQKKVLTASQMHNYKP